MTTLMELRGALRVLLNDNAAEGYLWSDAALDRYLNDAIRDYSRSCPQQKEAAISTVAGQREYDLPAGCLVMIGVEVVETADRWPLLPLAGGEGDQMGSPAGAGSYEVYAGKLLISPTPTETGRSLALRYLAPHATLELDLDLSTVPAADEDLLLVFACARALQGLSVEEAKRQRYQQRAGQTAEGAASLYWQQYQRGIKARTGRVRSGRLVASAGC